MPSSYSTYCRVRCRVTTYIAFHCFRYWFLKNQNKQWLHIGVNFKRFLGDVHRVWLGAGISGLEFQQVNIPLADINKPYLPVGFGEQRAARLVGQYEMQRNAQRHEISSESKGMPHGLWRSLSHILQRMGGQTVKISITAITHKNH